MKYVITERQYRIINEQSDYMMDRRSNAIANSMGVRSDKDYKLVNQIIDKAQVGEGLDPHTVMTVLAIGAIFIPLAGPFISAGIGLADAALYYKKGDKKTAGLTAAFSMIPFIGKIPGVKQLGSKGMALLASKLTSGAKNLTKAEAEIANAISKYTPEIQQEIKNMAPKLQSILKELEAYKGTFIKKYGQKEYDELLVKYLYDGIDKKSFIGKLKNVINPNIQVKPILSQGSYHRIFQSATNPNVVFKAELSPGEVNKWFDTFKKYPQIFAKTFRKVKVKGSNGELLDAVVMEKLNVSPFYQLWDDLTKVGVKFKSIPSTNENERGLEQLLQNIGNASNKEKWNNIIIATKKEYPNLTQKIDEFNKMIDKLYKITPDPDISRRNLGYDASGILKVLDL